LHRRFHSLEPAFFLRFEAFARPPGVAALLHTAAIECRAFL
jgi:hypothetical protein